jgi:Collagen triple helix repeat (20 copies)
VNGDTYACDGAPGQPGQPGQPGAAGPPGPPGPAGISGYEWIHTSFSHPGPFQFYDLAAVCTSGKRVLGGGFWADGAGVDVSRPFDISDGVHTGDGWEVYGQASALGGSVQAYAICANV